MHYERDEVNLYPVELRPLGWGRIALGILFLLRTTPLLLPLRLPFSLGTFPLLGWPNSSWHGAPVGFALPAVVVQVACVLRTLAALGFTLGVWTRACGLIAGGAGYLVMFQSPFGFVATLHLLFQGAILLALTDAAAVVALRPDRVRAPRSSFLLIRAFVASIYFWAGFCKLNPDWLSGGTLLLFRNDGAFAGPLPDLVLGTAWSRAVVACAIAATELSLPALLFWRATRRVAPWIALSMHAAIELAARPDLLGWEMAALLLCLWPVDSSGVESPDERVKGTAPAAPATQ
jgi:hypothetical protein